VEGDILLTIVMGQGKEANAKQMKIPITTLMQIFRLALQLSRQGRQGLTLVGEGLQPSQCQRRRTAGLGQNPTQKIQILIGVKRKVTWASLQRLLNQKRRKRMMMIPIRKMMTMSPTIQDLPRNANLPVFEEAVDICRK
jgi:hypothetical protein